MLQSVIALNGCGESAYEVADARRRARSIRPGPTGRADRDLVGSSTVSAVYRGVVEIAPRDRLIGEDVAVGATHD